jgi:hypothetical protein
MVERGLLPTLSYRERKRKEKNLSVLRIESAQLRDVPRVLDVHPRLGVAESICSSWDDFVDEVWALPWWLQLRYACLLEAKHEVAGLEGPFAYPSVVVIVEALLIDC